MKNYSIGIYEKAFPEELSIREMLICAKKAGYDFFEISIDRTDKRISRIYNEAVVKDYIKSMDEVGIGIESVGLSALGTYTLGNSNACVRKKGIDIFFHALKFAKKIGARMIQIPACDVPKNDVNDKLTHRKYIDNLRKIMKVAAKEGVLIGLENMENDYADTVEKCIKIIQEVKSPYLVLYPDSGNITSASIIYGNNPLEDLRKACGMCIAFHFKETKPNKYGGLFYGEGHVDFMPIAKEALEIGIRRFVMEYWYTGNPNWKEDLVRARKMVNKWFGGEKKC